MATNSMAISHGAEATSFSQGAVVVLGRFFFALIFLMAGANHFSSQTIGYAASQGVPLASLAVPLSGVIALAGGLSIPPGYRARIGAWLIVSFLASVPPMLANFWAASHPLTHPIPFLTFLQKLS